MVVISCQFCRNIWWRILFVCCRCGNTLVVSFVVMTDTPMTILAKLRSNWPGSFREKLTYNDDNRHQVMIIIIVVNKNWKEGFHELFGIQIFSFSWISVFNLDYWDFASSRNNIPGTDILRGGGSSTIVTHVYVGFIKNKNVLYYNSYETKTHELFERTRRGCIVSKPKHLQDILLNMNKTLFSNFFIGKHEGWEKSKEKREGEGRRLHPFLSILCSLKGVISFRIVKH